MGSRFHLRAGPWVRAGLHTRDGFPVRAGRKAATRSGALAVVAYLALGALGTRAAPPGARSLAEIRPPNVVFLLADDQAHDTLSAAGHPHVRTPNLDRLAREGTHFTRAFATTALCSPSRASFYTGLYARTHGVRHNALALQPDTVTFPMRLQAAGWNTAFVGKWHVGDELGGAEGAAIPGFDEVTAYRAQGRYLDNVFHRGGSDLEAGRVPTEGFVDDRVTDFALEFIRRERDRPFLLCVGFKGTHRPRTPAPRHAGLFAAAEFETPANYASLPPFPRRTEWAELSRRAGARVDDDPPEDWAEHYGRRWPMVLVRDRSEELRDYLRLVTALDENVGRVLDALDELDSADDTLVIYSSDHGFLEAEHGLFGKGTAYERSMRTVLLARYGRFEPRGPEERLALSVDVLPTVLELCGLDAPADVEGRSLVPLLRGDADVPWRTEVLYEFFRGRMYGGIPTTLAVRGERYKLITYPGYPAWTELYDLANDPDEMRDLSGSPEHASERARLERRLVELQAELAGPADAGRPRSQADHRTR